MTNDATMDEAEAPARRATDLPAGSPWWALWIEANIHKAWTVLYGFAGVAVEVYATYPAEINEIVKGVIPASWWPHLIAAALIVNAWRRAWKVRARS